MVQNSDYKVTKLKKLQTFFKFLDPGSMDPDSNLVLIGGATLARWDKRVVNL